jgi:protein-disulfide isomerase
MHICLYEHQQALGEKHLEKYAVILGLDSERFNENTTNHVHMDRIREGFLSGIQSGGVNGIPSFYINGVRYNGH